VRFDGEGQQNLLYVDGAVGIAYVAFEGIEWRRPADGNTVAGAAHDNRTVHHVKFLRCGFERNVNISYASTVLLEDCYAWGAGRYPFIAFVSDQVIFRRCVARLDAADGNGMPISSFINYASQGVELQNCIAIDSDDDGYSNFEGIYGGIYLRPTFEINGTSYQSTDTAVRGSIVLNVKNDRSGTGSGSASYSIGYGADNALIDNTVFWDMHAGTFESSSYPDREFRIDHSLFGITTTDQPMVWGNGQYGEVSNTIFHRINASALRSVRASTNNAFFENGTDEDTVTSSTGAITNVDPLGAGGLRYLVRTEADGTFTGAAGDGGNVGATILYRVGAPGSLWGEPDYDAVTAECLWPWPGEEIIQTAFRSAAGPPAADRGFCADGQSLTRYVWEYLGNPMPAELCPGTGPGAGGAAAAADPEAGAGCGCRVGRSGAGSASAGALLLLVASIGRRRRATPRPGCRRLERVPGPSD
jgi:hypothetical protein